MFPPRHGKSTLSSIYFPAWYLGKWPHKKVMLVSYGDEFASEWGRRTRDIIDDVGDRIFNIKVRKDSSAADRWEIDKHGGGMKTVGIEGDILGRGADLLLLDDPQKQEHVASETISEKQWKWFTGTARTRLNAGASIIVIMQRWSETDLVGRILEMAKETKEEWTVFNLPALAEENDILGRLEGEALWPERFPVSFLEMQKQTQGSMQFAAVYQQRPTPEGGGYFHRSWFKYYKTHGDYFGLSNSAVCIRHLRKFLTVDLAFAVKRSNDYTAICAWGVTSDCDLLLLDVHRERMTGDQLIPAIQNMMTKWECEYAGIEDTQAQLLVVQAVRKAGIAVRQLKANVDKITRSIPYQIRMEAGQVYFPEKHPELENLEHELLTFPNSKFDDVLDCGSYACIEIQRLGGAAIPQEERERREREAAEKDWKEKEERQRRSLEDWDNNKWYFQ